MTTPTPQTPAQTEAEKFRAEIRAAFAHLEALLDENRVEIAELRADLAQMREGLTHAAQPAPTPAGMTEIMQAVKITRTRTNGKWYYKMLGGRYSKRGVTIWDEVLKALNLDPEVIQWDTQDAYTFDTPLNVSVLLKEYRDETSGEIKTTPQKVISKA